MQIGKRIRAERLRAKLTQARLAALIGKTSDSISKFERDEIQPGSETLLKLARLFGTTVERLASDESEAA